MIEDKRTKVDEEELPVTDTRERDAEEMAKTIQGMRAELIVTNDALNETLIILSALYLQPFMMRRYFSNADLDHINFLLMNLMSPVARALSGGRTDTDAFKSQLARCAVMCLNYFINRVGIATLASEIEMEGVRYSIKEENGLPYSVQVEPEIPKTEYHDQPLELLLDEVHKRGNYEERKVEEVIEPHSESAN